MSDRSKRLTVEQLVETQEFQRLTPKQRMFVATYCGGGLISGNYDAVAATQTAYQCKNTEVARIMSYSVMANIRIVAVLNRHFNTEPIEEFLVLLDRAINNKKLTIAQLNALKLKCDILGFGTRIPNNQSFNVLPPDVIEASRAKKPKKNSEVKPRPPKGPDYSNIKV